MNTGSHIPNQVRLPLAAALAVVIQGLRIRLGRSAVTVTGVVCGIAFLMSILTGQLVKQGVSAEDARRDETARMMSFIHAELPGLRDRTIGVVGSVGEIEERLLQKIAHEDVAAFLFPEGAPAPRRQLPGLRRVPAAALAGQSDIILVAGDAPAPDIGWEAFFGRSRNTMAAITGSAPPLPGDTARQVRLAREWTAEELAAREREATQERFRSAWIVVVSLLVTVIGITNAMLMSVTERFREIGTMKCLGALSGFVTRIFVLEASIMGSIGGFLGVLLGTVFSISVYTATYGAGLVFSSLPAGRLVMYAAASLLAGVILSIIAAIYPARVAASMVPATALRSNV